ncbi:CDP-alcohol phosphatidyltransferase family protein [Catenuloplanes atrovinosus]|uniref:Phosphatidylglycerophosphate synthase n=1 Tax=Catenuloplanes atrovinosus TaxID=137266 RepID=A0AAE3YTG0_9ACTN|nr:CDP-alcohol phosphatidyltransferase family protein [Catenuloplanes atrovinosus]MDR7279608.1 phosphatidylglycerophosphate synthase [Catenuloplanes atrovinosus]
MTLAVLTAGAAVETARRDRLRDQLRRAGATRIVEPDTAADLATVLCAGTAPVLLVAADLVAHDAVFRHLATEPGGQAVALTGAGKRGLRPVIARGMIIGGAADGPAVFLGALRLAGTDRARAAHAVRRAGTDDLDALLERLVADGARVRAYPLRLLTARRCASGAEVAEAEAELAGIDEERARLRLAVKERDDFVATFLVSSWSPVITRACARLGFTPSAVTVLSVLCALAAALGFAQASRPAMIAGAVLLYLGFVLDCVDGQVARYTRRFTPLGGWLDTMADRAKEYAVYAGLAAGAVRLGHDGAWWLAVAAMAAQTVRHATDSWYATLHDTAAPRGRTGGALGRLSDRVIADGRSPVYWLKRVVVFPIGERWALIGVLAACAGGRAALLAVLGWGGAALLYTLALRGLRSRAMRVSVLATADPVPARDDGWLARRLPAVTGPLDWLLPAGLRLLEFSLLIGAGVVHRVPPWLVFALVFAVAMHHYDLTARAGAGYRPRWEPGWSGRSLAVAVLGGVAVPAVAAYTLMVLARRVSTTRTRDARLPGAPRPAGDAEPDLVPGRQAR